MFGGIPCTRPALDKSLGKVWARLYIVCQASQEVCPLHREWRLHQADARPWTQWSSRSQGQGWRGGETGKECGGAGTRQYNCFRRDFQVPPTPQWSCSGLVPCSAAEVSWPRTQTLTRDTDLEGQPPKRRQLTPSNGPSERQRPQFVKV